MARTTKPNHAEILGLMRHLADVVALRDEPTAQRQLLIDGLNRLLHTDGGFFYVADDWREDRPARFSHQTLTTQIDEAGFRYMASFAVTRPLDEDPFAYHSRRSDAPVGGWTLQGVLPDKAARRKFHAVPDLLGTARWRDGVVTHFRGGRDGASPDRITGFALHRFGKAKALSPKDLELARLAIEEVQRLVQRGHLALPGDVPAALPPRLRQILDRLLVGKSPKAIAREFQISLWTVRDHLKRLYQHFGVSGREELMARFIGKTLSTLFPFLSLLA